MPAPIPDSKRAAITRDIKAGKPRNTIARDHQVSSGTVTNIARQAGITDAFDRSQTEKGTRAKQFDSKLARAQLVEDLLRDAQRFRRRAWSQYTQVAGGPGGPELVTTKLPPLREQQAAYTSVGICLDKVLRLLETDGDDSTAHARSLLGQLAAGLDETAASWAGQEGPGS